MRFAVLLLAALASGCVGLPVHPSDGGVALLFLFVAWGAVLLWAAALLGALHASRNATERIAQCLEKILAVLECQQKPEA